MKKLYVGNLPFSVTEENIRAEFANLGIHADSITILRDRDTGQLRGFGFVEIADDGAAEKAIASLNGKDLMGRALVVSLAPRPPGVTAVAGADSVAEEAAVATSFALPEVLSLGASIVS